MSGYIRPISPLLLPGSNSLSAILHMPLQIASSESPVVSLSASSVTSYWVTYEPDSLCATDRTYYVLPTRHFPGLIFRFNDVTILHQNFSGGCIMKSCEWITHRNVRILYMKIASQTTEELR